MTVMSTFVSSQIVLLSLILLSFGYTILFLLKLYRVRKYFRKLYRDGLVRSIRNGSTYNQMLIVLLANAPSSPHLWASPRHN